MRPFDFQRDRCAIVKSKTGEQWWQHWSALDGAAAKYATGYYGEDAQSNPVFVKRYHDADDQAVFSMMGELERLKQVQDCPNIIQLLGVGQVASKDWCLVFELADRVLTGHQPSPELGAAIRRDIGAALDCLQARGLVHSDVAPNNIVRVGADWKLADFDSCVENGSPVLGVSSLVRYVAPGHVLGVKAETSFDTFGLDAIVEKYG